MGWDLPLRRQSELGYHRHRLSQSHQRVADEDQRDEQQPDAGRHRVRPGGGAPICQVAMKAPKADATRSIKTIVFADDDPFFVEAITEVLKSNGYNVQTAQDGLEALALIRQVKPECVVLSVVLPKLDGGQVCAAVRLDPRLRRTPIIVFSSLSPKDYALFPDLSADAYVAKGALTTASQNILQAISSFEERQPERKGLLLGYHDLQASRLVNDLLLERRFLRAIFEFLAPGALVLTPDGRIVMANAGACELLERRGVMLVGEHFADLLPLPDLLTAFGRSEPPSACRTTFQFGHKLVTARLAPIREGRTYTGLVVILEGAAVSPASGG